MAHERLAWEETEQEKRKEEKEFAERLGKNR